MLFGLRQVVCSMTPPRWLHWHCQCDCHAVGRMSSSAPGPPAGDLGRWCRRDWRWIAGSRGQVPWYSNETHIPKHIPNHSPSRLGLNHKCAPAFAAGFPRPEKLPSHALGGMDLHVDQLRVTLQSFLAICDDGPALFSVKQRLAQELGDLQEVLRDPLNRRPCSEAARYDFV